MFTTSTAAWSEPFSDSDIICVPYAGGVGAVNLPTKDGFKVSFGIEMEPVVVDGIGHG